MPGLRYYLDSKDLVAIQEYFLRLPGIAEDVVNEVIRNDVAKMAIQSMIHFTPVSKVNKKHARDSNPYKMIPLNMGIYIEEKIEYLVYPELGIGQPEQNFMWWGFNAVLPNFMGMIIDALTKTINE